GETDEARGELARATELYERAEVGLREQRETMQGARDAAQQAAFHRQSCDFKINDIDSSVKVISQALEARRAELAGYDEQPLQERLQQLLAVRNEREAALVRLRDELESMEAQL